MSTIALQSPHLAFVHKEACLRTTFVTHLRTRILVYAHGPSQIEVQDASDVQAAFRFSVTHGVPLAIKNTGVCVNYIVQSKIWSLNQTLSYSMTTRVGAVLLIRWRYGYVQSSLSMLSN